jgi:hypothetical protein
MQEGFEMNRRELIVGALASTVVVAAGGVASKQLDLLVAGFRYQSWPWGEPVPPGWKLSGLIKFPESELRPLSWFRPLAEEYEKLADGPIWWEPLPLITYLDPEVMRDVQVSGFEEFSWEFVPGRLGDSAGF